jgi:hypothetical protein
MIDLINGEFRAPTEKKLKLSRQVFTLLGRMACNCCWLSAHLLVGFAGKSQFLYLAIA